MPDGSFADNIFIAVEVLPMKKISVGLVLAALLCLLTATASAKTVAEEQARIVEVHEKAMDLFAKMRPHLIERAENSYGYATVSSSRVFFYERGRGLAVNNVTGEKVYLKMRGVDLAGLGLGFFCEEYDIMLFFKDEAAWDRFMTGKTKMKTSAQAVARCSDESGVGAGFGLTARDVEAVVLVKKGLEFSVDVGAMKIFAPKKLNGGY